MPHLRRTSPRSAIPPLSLVAVATALVLAVPASSSAFPRVDQTGRLPGVVAIDQPNPGAAAAPFTELHEALAAARSRLEELSRAAELMGARAELERATEAAQAESRRLSQELRASRQEEAEWARRHAAAEARIAELSAEVGAAQAKAQRFDQEVIALRWRNAQLETSLSEMEATRDDAEREARTLAARLEQLRDAGAQLAGLRQELAASRAELERAHAGLAEAEQAREASHAERAALAAEVERLDAELAAAQVEWEHVTAANQELAAEVAALDTAASAATEAARQNLIAFETRIRELHAALGPAAAHPAGADRPAAAPAAPQADRDAGGDGDGAPAVSGARLEAVPLPPPPRDQLERSPPAHIQDDLRVIKAAHLAERGTLHTIAQDTALLSRETQLQIENLLADLKADADDRGLRLTVPGAALFAVNSEYIEPGAYDALAKVAELISLYPTRPVLIIGHTDGIGDAGYNKALSERRARLVRQFFIENFDIPGDRLLTRGDGEARPIATNATQQGRDANRRVEVVLLD